MQYYFVKQKIDNNFILHESDCFHILSVMRAQLNTEIICVYNNKHYLSKIVNLNPLEVEAVKLLDINNENNYQINLIIGLIKKTKWDFILQKSTELGVNLIIPFKFKNTIINIADSEYNKKIKRWYKICKEASEQAQRNIVPNINDIIEDKIINLKKFMSDINIVCYEKSNNKLIEVINNNVNINKSKSITIVLGSEGGFTKHEISEFLKLGFNDAKLSKQILRTETATIYVLSVINYLLGCDELNDKF